MMATTTPMMRRSEPYVVFNPNANRPNEAKVMGGTKDELEFLRKSQEMAKKYEHSVKTKERFIYVYYVHSVAFAFVLIHICMHYCHTHYSRVTSKCFGLPQVPRMQHWQLVWLPSLGATALGYLSLRQSRLALMQMCFYGTLVFGLGPILGTIVLNGADIIEQVKMASASAKKHHNHHHPRHKSSQDSFLGVPVILFWYILLAACLQIHVISLYFSRILIAMWSDEQSRSKKK